MLATILSVFGGFLGKLALSILSALLAKHDANVEDKAAFLAIAQFLAAKGIVSVSLYESYRDQKTKNDAEVDQILKEREDANRTAPPSA